VRRSWTAFVAGVAAGVFLLGCGRAGNAPVGLAGRDAHLPELHAANLAAGERLRVAATTGIVGDVVRNVAGDHVELTTLIGPGQDPHTYQPTPRDIAAIEKAHVVFVNGFGLEEGLESTIDASAGKGSSVVSVSAGIQPRSSSVVSGPSSTEPAHGSMGDPHVWFDPANVKTWTGNIAETLSALDPANAAAYRQNAAAYVRQLDELDANIRTQVASIPAERRRLVTDHEALGYFADRYGFQVVGAVIPSVSTSAEPSAGDLAALVQVIRSQAVPAIFIGTTTNPKLADLVAKETGAQVLPLYTGELGTSGSGMDTYLGMMRGNLDTIVKGLTEER
jgi:ABC-type Zn uptake system ZnuABC Zn-binding protein ZnuA